QQLQDWAESEDTHPMVQAVYRYLEKKSLIADLMKSSVLELDDSGRLTDKVKIQGLGQTGANVRFVVYGSSMPQEIWKNQEAYQKYSIYYGQKLKEKKLCYATGKMEVYSDKHPSKVRNSADKAKLISGNDTDGFTYRGRFLSKVQAVSIGYDTSQKAHNALRWLIQKQGYTRDGSAIVCWMTNRDMQVIDIMKDSVNACKEIDDFDFDFDDFEADEKSGVNRHDTGKYFAEQFKLAVNGYAGKIEENDKVAIIALDSTSENKGRLSVVYYDEMGGKQYMDAVLNWQEHCKWRRRIKIGESEKKKMWIECTPSPRDMALAAYGIQRSEWLEADSKILKDTVKRLLCCITRKGVRIPQDLIRSAARRASMPQTMSDFVWYNDVLCVVCAMIRFNYEKGELTMDNFLQDNMDDRNVLFGRLLAVYDYMEQRALFERDENGKIKEGRTTNAKRYWNTYSSRPAKTAKTIRQNLIAYEKKLNDYELMKFEGWMGEIMTHLAGNGFDNTALSELYLPGYYLQMEEMKKAFQKKEQ
ncbi:MAG: type I-C CRISPR-associated protein Cas8c/Csd1, partial [Lachnospiraceae bacterium]|nr:type I-C CRISPR-associated protein Cas8c/Csd1 [Lachnospiraceae bacterium]